MAGRDEAVRGEDLPCPGRSEGESSLTSNGTITAVLVRRGSILTRASARGGMPHAPSPGTLFVVATPIGHLEDITLRAIRVLREVSLIAAEDTRRTSRLLNHLGITTRAVSLHGHNEHDRTQPLVERLLAG